MSETPYREVILDHFRQPRNAGRLDPCSHHGQASNPLCGDELEITLRETGGTIAEIRSAVRGCVIAQAGASLMTEAATGRSIPDVLALGRAFRAALEADSHAPLEDLGALKALLELRQHRSRIGCALLAWTALERALTPK